MAAVLHEHNDREQEAYGAGQIEMQQVQPSSALFTLQLSAVFSPCARAQLRKRQQ
jgi:hypothetical protein